MFGRDFRKIWAIPLFLLVSVYGYTQDISLITITPDQIIVCGNAVTFGVRVENLSAGTLTNIEIDPGFPMGINYVPDSHTSNVHEKFPGQEENQIFILNEDILPGADPVIVYFYAKADCRLIQNIQPGEEFLVNNATGATYLIGSTPATYNEPNGSESYNVGYADLDVFVATEDQEITPVNFGDPVNRHISVRNEGLGQLSELTLIVENDPEIEYDYIKLIDNENNEITLTPVSSVNGISEYKITDFSLIGNEDALFDNEDGDIHFIDQARVTDPNPAAQTNYKARWGCSEVYCNENDLNAIHPAYINSPNGTPQIESIFQPPADDIYYVTFENFGSGNIPGYLDAAFNVKLQFVLQNYCSADMEFYLLNENDEEIPISPSLISQTSDLYYIYTDINFKDAFDFDPDGPGGLENTDNDAYFDDLEVNGQLRLKAVVHLFVSETIEACQNPFSNNTIYSYLSYNNWAGEGKASPQNYYGRIQYINIDPNDLKILGDPDVNSNGIYDYTISFTETHTFMYIINCNENSYYRFQVTVPQGYLLNTVYYQDIQMDAENYSQNGNEINIQIPFCSSAESGKTHNVKMTFSIDCPESSPEGTITADAYYVFDPTVPEGRIHALCTERTIYHHCTPFEGIETTGMTVERGTFGWVLPSGKSYYTYDELFVSETARKIVDEEGNFTVDPATLRLDAAYPNDKVNVKLQGVSNLASSTSNLHLKVQYQSPIDENLLNPEQVKLTVNGDDVTVTPVITNTNTGNLYLFEFYCAGTVINPGDLIEAKITFRYLPSSGLPAGVHYLNNFRGFFGYNDNESIIYDLGLSDNFYFYKQSSYNYPSTTFFDCNKRLNVSYYTVSPATYNRTDFPNEYRPFSFLKSLSVDLPEGFSFDPSRQFEILYGGGAQYFRIFAPGYINNNHGLRFYTEQFPDIIISDYSSLPNVIIYAPVVTNNDFAPYDPELNTPYRYYNSVETREVYVESDLKQDNSTNHANSLINLSLKPVMEMTSNNDQVAYQKEVKWSTQICNNSTITYAEVPQHYWVAVELKPDDNTTKLTGASGSNIESVEFYGPGNRNMLIKLGTINRGFCNNFVINGEFSCDEDARKYLDLYSGWECNDYPAVSSTTGSILDVAGNENLILHEDLSVWYKLSNLQNEISVQVPEEADLCDRVTYDVTLTSTKYGDMYDVELWADMPAGVEIDASAPVLYMYPSETEGTWLDASAAIIPSSEPDRAGWDIKVLTGDPEQTDHGSLPGTRLSQGYNEIKFRISFKTRCDYDETLGRCTYDPGQPVKFSINGNKNCGEEVKIADIRKFNLRGIILDDISVQLSASEFTDCQSDKIITVKVENILDRINQSDKLELILPQGLSYAEQGNETPIPDEVLNNENITDNKPTVIIWNYKQGDLVPHVEKEYNVKVNISGKNPETESFGLYARTIMAGTLTCNSQEYPVEATTGESSLEIPFGNLYPSVDIVSNVEMPACLGTDIILNASVTGKFTKDQYSYQWNPVENDEASPWLVHYSSEEEEVKYYVVTVTGPNGCASSADMYVQTMNIQNPIRDLVINSEVNCSGERTVLLSVDYITPTATYQWTKNNAFIPDETNPEITVTDAGTYSVMVSDNNCGQGSEFIEIPMNTMDEVLFSTSKSIVENGKEVSISISSPVSYHCQTCYCKVKKICCKKNNCFGYKIEWGDGAITRSNQTDPKKDKALRHIYQVPGIYTVSLTAQHEFGCPVTGTQTIKVLRSLCTASIPSDLTNGRFYFDNKTGRFVYRSDDCPGEFVLNCFTGPAEALKLDKVVSAQALTYSDDWELYDYKTYTWNRNDFDDGRHGKWRPKSTYVFNTELKQTDDNKSVGTYTIDMFNWQFEESNNPDRWIRSNTIEMYSKDGMPVEEKNALNVPGAVKYDRSNGLPYLVSQNARYDDVLFENFEELHSDEYATQFFEELIYNPEAFSIIPDKSHSGKKCIELPASSINQNDEKGTLFLRSYIISEQSYPEGLTVKFWAKPKQQDFKETLENQLQVIVNSGSVQIHNINVLAHNWEWYLCECTMKDLPVTTGEAGTSVMLKNTGPEDVYIDDLKLQPADAEMATYVYDPATLKVIAIFDNQHFGTFYQYNQEGKLIRKLIETEEGMRTVQENIYHIPKKDK